MILIVLRLKYFITGTLGVDDRQTARAVMTTNKGRRDSFQVDSPVLLRPQTQSSVGGPIQRLTDALHKCQATMKESPLTVLGLSTKRTPKISEVIQQTKVLCEVMCSRNLR